jgi:hypothetical protein
MSCGDGVNAWRHFAIVQAGDGGNARRQHVAKLSGSGDRHGSGCFAESNQKDACVGLQRECAFATV